MLIFNELHWKTELKIVLQLVSISRYKHNPYRSTCFKFCFLKDTFSLHPALYSGWADGEPTQSSSKDISVLTNSVRDGTKGFTAADHVCGKRKENQAWKCFRGAGRHWPSQLTVWSCSHRVVTRHTVVSFFPIFFSQNLRMETWQSFFLFFLGIMTSEKEMHCAGLFLAIEWGSSDSLCSHTWCANVHPMLAQHSHHLALMTIRPLTYFYYSHCLDINNF